MKNYIETEFQKSLIALSSNDFNKAVAERFKTYLSESQDKSNIHLFGFETGPGWRPMLWALFEDIEVIAIPYKIKIELQQVKEKFGSLRFYYNATVDGDVSQPSINKALKLIESLVDQYEEISYKVCDETGRNYKYRIASGSWVYACCYDAFVKRFAGEHKVLERVRKDIVARVQFDRIIGEIKQANQEKQFITSLSQAGLLSDYLDDVSISKLVENEFWLDSDKL